MASMTRSTSGGVVGELRHRKTGVGLATPERSHYGVFSHEGEKASVGVFCGEFWVSGCGRNAAVPGPAADAGRPTVATTSQDASAETAESPTPARPPLGKSRRRQQLDVDGNDDPEDPGTGQAPMEATGARARFAGAHRIQTSRLSTGRRRGARGNQPLGTDGDDHRYTRPERRHEGPVQGRFRLEPTG